MAVCGAGVTFRVVVAVCGAGVTFRGVEQVANFFIVNFEIRNFNLEPTRVMHCCVLACLQSIRNKWWPTGAISSTMRRVAQTLFFCRPDPPLHPQRPFSYSCQHA